MNTTSAPSTEAAGTSRRDFLKLGAAAGMATLASAPVSAQQPAAQYDLLIAGGRVVDGSLNLSAIRDVAIAGGVIAQVAENIPRAQAKEVIDARGRLVTPGWIDMHTHVFDGVAAASIDPDVIGLRMGVTTLVDGGSAGAQTYPGFKKHIIDRAQTSVYALLNISRIGFVVTNESYIDPRLIDAAAATEVIKQNRDRILGIKVRFDGREETADADVEILRKGREASDATGIPVLMHWARDPRLVGMLKAGDIITHPFNPPRAGPDLFGPDGKIMAQFLNLKERGISVDFAHGGHLLWATAEKAAAQKWFPDIISTDLHRSHVAPNGNVISLATTLAKFLYLGMSVDQVIAAATTAPAKALKFGQKIGSLAVGSVADVTICEVVDKPIELLDSLKDKRAGKQQINPTATIKGGKLYNPGSRS